MALLYRLLCWIVGALLIAGGLLQVGLFFASIAPGGTPPLDLPLGPLGYYAVAMSGAALVGWGGCVLAASRGDAARAISAATAFGLSTMAAYRIAVWFTADAAQLGDLPLRESVVFLALALLFLWLRPSRVRTT